MAESALPWFKFVTKRLCEAPRPQHELLELPPGSTPTLHHTNARCLPSFLFSGGLVVQPDSVTDDEAVQVVELLGRQCDRHGRCRVQLSWLCPVGHLLPEGQVVEELGSVEPDHGVLPLHGCLERSAPGGSHLRLQSNMNPPSAPVARGRTWTTLFQWPLPNLTVDR